MYGQFRAMFQNANIFGHAVPKLQEIYCRTDTQYKTFEAREIF